MARFVSHSSLSLILAGAISALAISNASAFGGMHFGGSGFGGFGGGMMHSSMGGAWGMHPSMGGMRQHFPVSTPSWIGGGNHPSSSGNNCGYGGGCGGIWGNHTTQAKLPPSWGHNPPRPWLPAGGQVASHCNAYFGCGRPWHPGFPWHPAGYPWHPTYPVVYHLPAYTPSYTAPAYTAPVTYTAPAPTYTAPVVTTQAYSAPATYTAPPAIAPAVATSTCQTADNQQYVSVTFQSNASANDTASFLKAYNLVVQDGPNQDGSFRLRLQTALPQDQMGQMIDSMKSQSAIVSQAAAS